MERRYYNANSLEQAFRQYESHYGLSSDTFYEAWLHDDEKVLGPIAGRHRHAWASLYREWRELTEGELVGNVTRDLLPA